MDTTTIEPTEEVTTTPRPRFRAPLIPSPRCEDVSGHKPIRVTLPVDKGCFSFNDIPSSDARSKPDRIYHLYVRLSNWIGRTMPDDVNPRSHDPECLKSDVAKDIERTIIEAPEDFFLGNRGTCIMARSLEYDSKKGLVHITLTNPEMHGLADGATTDAVIAKVQTKVAREVLSEMGDENAKTATYQDLINKLHSKEDYDKLVADYLKKAFLHLEIHTDLDDRARIAALVGGRNTSRQVKSWSMSDFTGMFDWLKKIIDGDEAFAGKVGWEENSGKDITVLDILARLTLFHPEFDGQDANGDKAPVVAYANKGKMDVRLKDEKLRKEYTRLAPLVPDILKLYEYLYSSFEVIFDSAFGGKARLGSRQGVKAMHHNPIVLPFTGLKSNYDIPDGYLFPMLSSLRALVSYEGKAHWEVEPFEFLRKHGKMLMVELIEQVKAHGNNPNVAGKKKLVYTALHAKTQIALTKEKR